MSCSIHTIPAPTLDELQREGMFFKAAHGFSDSSGGFTFHMDWTEEGGGGRQKKVH